MNLAVNQEGVVSTSRGLVGDTTFAVLPTIQPIHTFMITIMFQMVGHNIKIVIFANAFRRFSSSNCGKHPTTSLF